MVDTSVAVATPSTTMKRITKGSAKAGRDAISARQISAGVARWMWDRSSFR